MMQHFGNILCTTDTKNLPYKFLPKVLPGAALAVRLPMACFALTVVMSSLAAHYCYSTHWQEQLLLHSSRDCGLRWVQTVLGYSFWIQERLQTQSVEDNFSALGPSNVGVVISKLKCYERMSSLNRGWTSWHSTSGHMTVASWANKGGTRWSQNQTSMQVHYWSPLLDHKGFKKPSSSPIVLSPKDFCFLPVDDMHSLLDMHGNSILGILVLDRPSVLCHTDSQRPPGLSNISCWAFSTRNWVHHFLHVHHPWSSFHFREGFPEGISGSEDRLYTQWLACFALLWSSCWCPWCMAETLWPSVGHFGIHLASSSASSQVLASGTHLPWEPFGHASARADPSWHICLALWWRHSAMPDFTFGWCMVWAVVEVVIRVGGFPVHTLVVSLLPSFFTWTSRKGIDPSVSFSIMNWISAHWLFRCSRKLCSSLSPCS